MDEEEQKRIQEKKVTIKKASDLESALQQTENNFKDNISKLTIEISNKNQIVLDRDT